MAKPTKKTTSSLDAIEIKGVPSQYSEGTWASTIARLRWSFKTTSVSVIEERSAQAVGHRLVADALEATPPHERWNVSTELLTSYANVVEIRISIELADGTAAEMESARTLLTTITARVK